MVELVDTQDLKSCGHLPVRVQVPLLVHSIAVPSPCPSDFPPLVILTLWNFQTFEYIFCHISYLSIMPSYYSCNG